VEPDIRVDFHQDGELIQLKAFKSQKNDLIMKENNIHGNQLEIQS
jgi:hypothetical protein